MCEEIKRIKKSAHPHSGQSGHSGEKQLCKDEALGQADQGAAACIQVQNIYKTYPVGDGAVNALNGLSFNVESGEYVAITGPSGCGKSTLLHILGGLDTPNSGTVHIFGKDLYARSQEQLAAYRREKVGIVYQFYNLVPELTARENLILPALLGGRKTSISQCDAMLDKLGLLTRADCFPNALSGGQQQKIAIGRAIINEPKILLADEPTGNLDSVNRDAILDLLKILNETLKLTLLVVTHDPVVAGTARRNIRLFDGRIIGDEVVR